MRHEANIRAVKPLGDARLTLARVMAGGICGLVVAIGIGRFGYTPLLPVMRVEAGLGAATAGWLATVNYIGYLAGALIASATPSLERKFLLYRLGLVAAAVTTLAMASTTNLWLWLVLRFVAGMGSAAGPLLGAGLVLNWLLRNGFRPHLGIYFGGVGAGIVVSGVLAAVMAHHLGWREQWLALGALSLAFLVPAWLWVPPPAPAAGDGGVPVLPVAVPPSRRWIARFHLAYFAGGFVFVVTATYIVDIIRHLGSVAIPGAWVWIIMGALAIPSCIAWDRVADAMGSMRALSLAYALQTVSCVLIALDGGLSIVALAALCYGITFMGIASLTLSIIGKLFPADPARAMARLTLSYGAAQILGPIVAGYLAETGFGYRGALMVTTAVGCAGALVSLATGPANGKPTLISPPT